MRDRFNEFLDQSGFRPFINPHTEWETIELPRSQPEPPESEERILDIPRDADVSTALDQLPDSWFETICRRHHLDSEDPSSARRALCRRLTDEEVIRELLTEQVPFSAREILRHLLNRDGLDVHTSVMQTFSGEREDILWMSEDAPRFRISRLHDTGLVVMSVQRKQTGDLVLELIPEDVRSPLASVLDEDPPCNVSFNLKNEIFPTLPLPPSSFFEEMEEHLRTVHDHIEEGVKTRFIRAIFHGLPENLFVTVFVLIQILNRNNISIEHRRRLVEGFLSTRSGEMQNHPDVRSVVEALLFSTELERWIVGYDDSNRLRVLPEVELLNRLGDLPMAVHWEEFVVGDFEPVLLMDHTVGLSRRTGEIVPPALNVLQEPKEIASRWLEKTPETGHPRPEKAAKEVISWVRSEPESLDEHEIRQLLSAGFEHANSQVRESALIGMEQLADDMLDTFLPKAFEDSAKTVRDRAQKIQDRENPSSDGQLSLFE